jgi:pyridoxal 5'-phosphate synthase pdxT subunit
MARIGVLALQGSVAEHMAMLGALPCTQAVAVKSPEDLRSIDGIILPGGESTTIGKLLREFRLFDLLKSKIEDGLPVWGTCAGMILLAKEITGESPHLAVMDITVRRNAYGRQIDSFERQVVIPKISADPIELIFIRAPWVEAAKDTVEILCSLDGHIVATRQANMLATSFHPELTDNIALHRYFVSMVNEPRLCAAAI